MQKNIATAKHMIATAKKIAIFWHSNPDGDCIGAMLGMGALLEKQKKQVCYFVPQKPSKIFNFLKNINRLKSRFDYKNYDLLIFVDFTWLDRIWSIGQANPEYFTKKTIIIFDHHPEIWLDNAIVIKDTHSISACEIIFEQTYKWRPKLYDKKIATYIYLGITSDSGNFLFGENHIRTFTNALKLLKLGADKDFVIENMFRKKSYNAIQFLEALLGRIEQKNEILYTYYDEEELKQYNIDQEEAAYALHIIQNIDGPKIVLLISKRDKIIKWSLRSKTTDCNKIAKILWGGGHKLASGFTLPAKGKFTQQIQEIVQKIYEITK